MSTSPVHYHLDQFPPTDLDWKSLLPLIGPAHDALGRYDGLLSAIPNAHVLLSPLTTQEAVLSSRIEGTQVTIGEVLEIEAGGQRLHFSQPKRDDAEEVLNYRKTVQACTAEMKHRSISQHLLRSAHSMLMQGVRGRDKTPGSYRTDQNWIGPSGCTIEASHFVPISPLQLQSGMDQWERFLQSREEPDLLVQLAVLHVEFEALHPFKDGNGRLGRMLIPLFLFERRMIGSPDFYMSGYLEAKREEYIERLSAVSRRGEWTAWCAFFLKGITRQAAANERKAREILGLYDRMKTEVADLIHSQHAIRTVDFLFRRPVFTATAFATDAQIPRATANRFVAVLREHGILIAQYPGSGQRAGVYQFHELIAIADQTDSLDES